MSFVDYGDEQWIGTEGLKTLKKEHIELPAQAIKCSLLDVVPAASRWTEEIVSTFEELVYDKNLVAQVISFKYFIYVSQSVTKKCGVSVGVNSLKNRKNFVYVLRS